MAETPIRKDVKVIAVDITGDEQRWRKGKALFPQEWVNALARDNIEDDGIYVVKATPTFYLLNSNGIVLIKDPSPEEILHVISASD